MVLLSGVLLAGDLAGEIYCGRESRCDRGTGATTSPSSLLSLRSSVIASVESGLPCRAISSNGREHLIPFSLSLLESRND